MRKAILFSVSIIISLGFLVQTAFGQSAVIQGTITDAETKESLIGVNIVEVDRNGRYINGATTDVNGNYVLQVDDVNNEIHVSYISYRKEVFKVGDRGRIDIELQSESILYDEVVITAERIGNDGFQSVRDRGTAVQRIEMGEMKSLMTSSVEDMLQGRLGNVDISSFSGDPGSGLNIRIRGTASLNARNQPLIVINGIPYDAQIDDNFDFASADIERFGSLIDVSPEDIESIEVLKDAASTAIWGARASNGVIMIKTKRGIQSKPLFEYNVRTSVSTEPPPIPMLDGAGYARLISEAFYNVSRNEFFTSNPNAIEISFDPEWEDYYNYAQDTDWLREITQTAFSQDHNFSVRGGGEKSRYNVALGFVDEGGTTVNNNLQKINLRSSIDYTLSSKLQFRSDIMFTRYDQNNTYDYEDGEFGNWKSLRSVAYRKMPNLSVFDRDTLNQHYGNYFTPIQTLQGNSRDSYNPVAFANLGSQNRVRDNSRALFSVIYSITDNIILNSTVTMDIFDNKISKFLPYKALGYEYSSDITNRAINEFSKKNSIFTFNQLIYRPELGEDHDLAMMTQIDTESTNSRWYKSESSRSASPFLTEPINDKSIVYFGANNSEFRSAGIFATANYKYKDKYSIMVGAKYEGNSKFSSESRWGLFPTVSAFWRISEEAFLSNASFLDDLRLRFSWGQTGNTPNQNYLYFNTYTAGSEISYMDLQGVRPTGLELTSLKWETIEQINYGITLLALSNKLSFDVDFYRKTTFDLLLENSGIPGHSGFSSLTLNDGVMENSGWEFLLDYTVVRTNDFVLAFNGNISTNQNKVIRLPENYSLEYGNMLENGNYRISIVPGQPIGGFFGYEYLGVYPSDADAIVLDANGFPVYGFNSDTPMSMIMGGTSGYIFEGGDAMYKDQNNDGKIDELDLVYLGDLNPQYMGGFGGRIEYKGVVLNTFFSFKIGQNIINQTRMDTEKMYNFDNQSMATNWRWRREGDITDMPRALYNRGFNWLGSNRFVEDGSHLRLRTISLSYAFPKRITDNMKIRDLRVFTTAYNLITWTNYSGQDPDVAPPSRPDVLPRDFSRTPPARRLMFGINFGF